MAGDDIAMLLQNAEYKEILPEERNADGINFEKQKY
jgi:hypothetical protein